MRTGLIVFALAALCAAQDRTLHVVHIDDAQQIQEIATLIQAISGAHLVTAGKELSANGSADQLALAGWLLNELDQPADHPPSPREYRLEGGGQNVVRIFYLPFTSNTQELQEAVTLIRSLANIRYMFTVDAPKAMAMRGTADQCALAEWLVGELAKPADSDATPYRMPDSEDDVAQVLRMPRTKTASELQEIAVAIRTIGRIPRLFTYNPGQAIAVRGSSDQISLAQWLAQQLDHPGISNEHQMSEGPENIVRVFYLPHTASVAEFQKKVHYVRTHVDTKWTCTCNTPRALVMRGTSAQIALAQQLVAETVQ
jgi:hypothetical protein